MGSHSLHQIEACSDLQSQNSRRLGSTPLTPRGFPSPAVYTEAVSQWDKEVVSRALMLQISIRTRCGDRRKMLMMKRCRRGVGYSGPGGTIVWKPPRGGIGWD
jgi:hypothetical protein